MPTPTLADPRSVILPCARCYERAFAITLPAIDVGVIDKIRALGAMLAALSGGAVSLDNVTMIVGMLEHPAGVPADAVRSYAEAVGVICAACLSREVDAALDSL